MPAETAPVAPAGLVVYPEVLVSSGKVRLSFVLRNRTSGSLFQIRIFPRIPEALHIFVNVPPVPLVQAGERLNVSYEVEPSACGEFSLGGDLLYEDADHRAQWLVIPPISFAVQCPLLAPAGVNMAQIQQELPRKAQAHREFLVSDLPRELLGQVARRAMATFNLAAVESLQGTDPASPAEIWFAGQVTKDDRPLYVQVQVFPAPARVLVTAWGPDNDAVTGFMARFAEVLMTELGIVRHLQDQARGKIVHAARVGELLVTLSDFCMMEWHRADTRAKLEELDNLLGQFDAPANLLEEVRAWVQKLADTTPAGEGEGSTLAPKDLTPPEREALETALVKWKDAIEQLLAQFSLQVKEVTPSAVPA